MTENGLGSWGLLKTIQRSSPEARASRRSTSWDVTCILEESSRAEKRQRWGLWLGSSCRTRLSARTLGTWENWTDQDSQVLNGLRYMTHHQSRGPVLAKPIREHNSRGANWSLILGVCQKSEPDHTARKFSIEDSQVHFLSQLPFPQGNLWSLIWSVHCDVQHTPCSTSKHNKAEERYWILSS